MSNDHLNQHDQQQHDAHKAAALLATPTTMEETPTAPEATSVEDESIAMLPPEIVEQVRQLGIAPAKVNRYGAERVRWVLERLQADRARKVISNPAGWVMQVLKDTWGQPLPVVQMGLPFAEAAAKATRPPAGTRWGRHRDGGHVLEVLDVNEARAQLAGGSVIPSHRWEEWEWLTTNSDEPVAIAFIDQDRDYDTAKQTAMAMLGAWVAAGIRTPDQLAAKLEARGLTLGDWEAYQAAGGRV